MNTIDITPIVNAALALIGAGVSVFLIPWLKKQTTEAQRKELTARDDVPTDQIYAFVSTIFNNLDAIAAPHGKGAELDLEAAASVKGVPYHPGAAKYFEEKGFKVDEESVVNAIEAIVKQLNTEGLTIE